MEEEEDHQSLRNRIHETVVDILKGADLELLTEFKVRAAVSDRLGVDLSTAGHHRKFVREVVESYLLSSLNDAAAPNQGTLNGATTEVERHGDGDVVNGKVGVSREGSHFICKLSTRRNVTVQGFEGRSLVSIRDYYLKDGKQLPSKSGISLTAEQWSALRESIPAIEEAILMLQTKLRSALKDQPIEPSSDVVTSSSIDELVPVNINRFDGKNYQSWTSQMELFLKQLKIAYVLTDPCPSDVSSTEATGEEVALSKVSRLKWLNDDYLCRHSILSSLSDSLYHQYSMKANSAKELWEELKLVFLYEEFGTKRALVKKYIEFQMVEEKSIVLQVQELNSIADSLVASGFYVDENFHVSAVISKLPPSWKDFSIKLMREEYLPFWVMMDRVKMEEESRELVKQGKPPNSAYSHPSQNVRPSMRDLKKPGMQWKRQETHADGKPLVCHFCGKKGHLAKTCRIRKYKEANGSSDKENLAVLQSLE